MRKTVLFVAAALLVAALSFSAAQQEKSEGLAGTEIVVLTWESGNPER